MKAHVCRNTQAVTKRFHIHILCSCKTHPVFLYYWFPKREQIVQHCPTVLFLWAVALMTVTCFIKQPGVLHTAPSKAVTWSDILSYYTNLTGAVLLQNLVCLKDESKMREIKFACFTQQYSFSPLLSFNGGYPWIPSEQLPLFPPSPHSSALSKSSTHMFALLSL